VFPGRVLVVVVAFALAACAAGVSSDLGSEDDIDLPRRTRPDGGGAPLDSAAGPPATAAGQDGGGGTTVDAAAGPPATGMHVDLKLPSAGAVCSPPGTSCPGIEVCRIATKTQGRCEGCTSCGNLHAPCSANTDCDILFQCFKGRCTNICPLGTSYCGPVEDCVDVGHATHGVCR
jgi:hypothetical protein